MLGSQFDTIPSSGLVSHSPALLPRLAGEGTAVYGTTFALGKWFETNYYVERSSCKHTRSDIIDNARPSMDG